jgi:hypothetical protein
MSPNLVFFYLLCKQKMLDDTLGQVIPLYASATGNDTFGVKHYADNV